MNKAKNNRFRHLPARKLVLSYLILIMTMSIIFSSIFYVASGQGMNDDSYRLAGGLVLLNIGILGVGSVLSYWLARITLRPIEKTLDQQDQYIADASHELRTPLASTLLSNEVALKNRGLTLPQARAIIEGNVKDMQELSVLSEGLLQESENQSSALKFAAVDTRNVIQWSIEKLEAIANEKHAIIKNDTVSIMAVTDADVLHRALVILIENAIKYSPAQSTITVTSYRDHHGVAIVVTDQGVGIDTDDLGNIFERFYRADHTRAQVAGYGLGLSIAKKSLEKIDGKMSVKSTVGTGSEFTITLPNRNETPVQQIS